MKGRAQVGAALLLLALASSAAAENPVERLQQRINSGEVRLEFRPGRGYLDSLLEAFGISPLTQTLVFSKTSAQFRLISPRSPRALYFNDDVYIGWVRGGPFLEVSTADADRGAAFYTLPQRAAPKPAFAPDNGQCLQCHETTRTLRIPGHLTRSVHPSPDGQPVFRLGTTDVDQTTSLADRFGGWYITAATFPHRGNRVLPDEDEPERVAPMGLDTVVDLDAYLRPDSDLVAHLLLAHQTQTHNRIARAALEARKALDYRADMTARFGEASPELEASVKRRVEGPAEDLLRYLLFSREAEMPAGVSKRSPLATEFSKRGPLYELDLRTRLLRTPLSYLILSDPFDALPPETLAYLSRRLRVILDGADDTGRFDHLTSEDRRAIRAMLTNVKPSLLAGGS